MLRSLHQDVNRADELVKLIKRIHSSNKTRKIVIFAPYDYGAFDVALKALKAHCIEGFHRRHDDKVNFEYIDDKKSAETRREIIRLYSSIDISESDQYNPRVLYCHSAMLLAITFNTLEKMLFYSLLYGKPLILWKP